MNMISDFMWRLAADNLQTIGLGVAGVALLIWLLGIARRLAGALLGAALHAGDAAARRMAEKPRAVALALGVFALGITGLWAYHTFTAPKIEQVPVPVPDDDAIRSAIAAERQAQEARRRADEARRAEVQQELERERQARREAEQKESLLQRAIHAVVPAESDEDALARLKGEIDTLHEQGVYEDSRLINPSGTRQVFAGYDDSFLRQSVYKTVRDPRANYRSYRTYNHHHGGETYYHRGCRVCDENFQARQKIDAIIRRRPELAHRIPSPPGSAGIIPPPPPPDLEAERRNQQIKAERQERAKNAESDIAAWMSEIDAGHETQVASDIRQYGLDLSRFSYSKDAYVGNWCFYYHRDCEKCRVNQGLAEKICARLGDGRNAGRFIPFTVPKHIYYTRQEPKKPEPEGRPAWIQQLEDQVRRQMAEQSRYSTSGYKPGYGTGYGYRP
jgi:hypothetical protein